MTENLNYSSYTNLPVRTCLKADKAFPVIEVTTPHKGVVFVEVKEVDKGLFRHATEIYRETKYVVNELRNLETEAKEFLLREWLKTTS